MPEIKTDQVIVHDVEERRAMRESIEFREAEDGASIQGYAAVFNKETVIGGMFGFREVIAPGAFDDAIKTDDVRALFNHDANLLLGRTTNETLRLSADKRGLRYEVDLNPDDPDAVRVRAKIKRGDVTGSSFAFRVPEDGDEWNYDETKKGKLPLRTIRKVELYDVSPVTYPAYPQTSVSARSKAQAAADTAKAEAEAREAAKSPDMKQRDAARAAVEKAKAWEA